MQNGLTEKLTISEAEYAAFISEANTSRSRPLLPCYLAKRFSYKTDDLRSIFGEALRVKKMCFFRNFCEAKKAHKKFPAKPFSMVLARLFISRGGAVSRA